MCGMCDGWGWGVRIGKTPFQGFVFHPFRWKAMVELTLNPNGCAASLKEIPHFHCHSMFGMHIFYAAVDVHMLLQAIHTAFIDFSISIAKFFSFSLFCVIYGAIGILTMPNVSHSSRNNFYARYERKYGIHEWFWTRRYHFSVEFFLLCRVLSDVDYALFVSIRPFT